MILDWKPYPKIMTIERSDGFLNLRESSLDTRWEVEPFRLFSILIYPNMASRLGKHLLRANSKNENFQSICSLSLLFFICFLSVPWLTFSNYWGNSLTHLILITAFGLSVFGPKMTRSGWVYISNWAPRRLWSKWHNPLKHSPQVAGNTLPRLAPRFSRMWKFPQYPKKL